ncbi:MAG: 1,6-anhydro-N-acetylmuramyl-L-alanine amidase AmpD [Syntrophorhabdus sp. PtaU1.Bin153]|nr:MAG: 1,6-anhydro-N-acetylmuramyl-L-alanine amidase AmpD [Syntrophorhabdus sp. PtaU1.Bin153]
MEIIQRIESPNFDRKAIGIQFLIIHYTASTLQRATDLFSDPTSGVSCHLLIDETGNVYEIVKCWEGLAYKARHCGESHWNDGNRTWSDFNNISLGLELVNANGNIVEYTAEQYRALKQVIGHLKEKYPELNSPHRVLGHEHIAGWRGKADPGLMFDWAAFFESCYPGREIPKRQSICPIELQIALRKFLAVIPKDEKEATNFWHALSYITETCVSLLNRK